MQTKNTLLFLIFLHSFLFVKSSNKSNNNLHEISLYLYREKFPILTPQEAIFLEHCLSDESNMSDEDVLRLQALYEKYTTVSKMAGIKQWCSRNIKSIAAGGCSMIALVALIYGLDKAGVFQKYGLKKKAEEASKENQESRNKQEQSEGLPESTTPEFHQEVEKQEQDKQDDAISQKDSVIEKVKNIFGLGTEKNSSASLETESDQRKIEEKKVTFADSSFVEYSTHQFNRFKSWFSGEKEKDEDICYFNTKESYDHNL
jgi:hypothetical protein